MWIKEMDLLASISYFGILPDLEMSRHCRSGCLATSVCSPLFFFLFFFDLRLLVDPKNSLMILELNFRSALPRGILRSFFFLCIRKSKQRILKSYFLCSWWYASFSVVVQVSDSRSDSLCSRFYVLVVLFLFDLLLSSFSRSNVLCRAILFFHCRSTTFIEFPSPHLFLER